MASRASPTRGSPVGKSTRAAALRKKMDEAQKATYVASATADKERYERERVKNKSTYWMVFDLIWRDYFRF